MKSSPFTLLILVAAVLALVLGPVVIILFLGAPLWMSFGGGLLFFGAAGLWIGMKALERGREDR
jgi:hypothetical protein